MSSPPPEHHTGERTTQGGGRDRQPGARARGRKGTGIPWIRQPSRNGLSLVRNPKPPLAKGSRGSVAKEPEPREAPGTSAPDATEQVRPRRLAGEPIYTAKWNPSIKNHAMSYESGRC